MSGFERLLIGRTVGGHYGGFGVVFRATDLRPARRVLAEQVLARLADEETGILVESGEP
jgi:hypothetical protein